MRRGRFFCVLIALVASAAFFSVVPAAFADGGTPADICKDLQDGVLNGSYTPQQIQAFLQDPTVQGYCGPITITVTPPPVTPPPSTAPPSTPVIGNAPAVSVAPLVVSAVKAAHKTIVAPAKKAPIAQVKGTQHTAPAPVASAAPLTTTKKTGTLPFTGAQLWLFVLVALALVGTGLVLRRTGRRSQS